MESVTSIEEFSAEDCDCLKEVLAAVPSLALEFFTLCQCSISPQVLLYDHVPGWPRFQELVLLLGSGLADISDRWADGKGPLALHFTQQEVCQLVLAMFENTSKRQALLTELRRTSCTNSAGSHC